MRALTPREKAFVGHYVRTGDSTYAAAKAGYSHPERNGYRNLERPCVMSAIVEQQDERMCNEALPLAVDAVISILRRVDANPLALNRAADTVFKYVRARTDVPRDKPLSEMTLAELERELVAVKGQRVAVELTRRQAETLEPIEAAPEPQAEPLDGLFE